MAGATEIEAKWQPFQSMIPFRYLHSRSLICFRLAMLVVPVCVHSSLDYFMSAHAGPVAQLRLERTPDKGEVGSSTLRRPSEIGSA